MFKNCFVIKGSYIQHCVQYDPNYVLKKYTTVPTVKRLNDQYTNSKS